MNKKPNENQNNSYKKFLLVFNPAKDRIKAQKRLQEVTEKLYLRDCSFEVTDSQKLKSRNDLNSFDSVVAVGGDGTVLSVISAISGYKGVKLGVIPCGTANLFAAGLSIPHKLEEAIEILFNGEPTQIDIGKAGDKFFALRVGLGFDADIVNGADKYLKDKFGYLAYFIQGLKNCFKLSRKKVRVTIDGRSFVVNANSIIVSNSSNMYSNKVFLSPHCSINDGKLDVFILMSKNFGDFLKVLWQLIRKKYINSSSVIYGQCKNIIIESFETNTHIDGEPLSNNNIDIRILPKALRVLVPNTKINMKKSLVRA